jgi:hypothetical protein
MSDNKQHDPRRTLELGAVVTQFDDAITRYCDGNDGALASALIHAENIVVLLKRILAKTPDHVQPELLKRLLRTTPNNDHISG